MSSVVMLEWQFSPPDYFEQAIEILRDVYAMTIADGKVTAEFKAAVFDADPSLRQTLTASVNNRFRGVQLLTHRAYELSNSTMVRVHPDGRRDISMELQSGCLVISGGSMDFLVTDKDGSVVADSKRDRIERKNCIAELVSAHGADMPLAAMLRSYQAGIRDPNNELVHLYEVRETLSVRFGDERLARAALSVTRAQWSRLGQLCNDEPLRQGRHRGKAGKALRDASEGELAESRGITRAMIEAYLQYLELHGQSGNPQAKEQAKP